MKSIPNSGGTLCHHICGNLQHFIGHLLGGSDYKRDRDAEFSGHTYSRAELVSMVENTQNVLAETFKKIHVDLTGDYPVEFLGQTRSTLHVIQHLYGHMNYHLGQLDYHRRGVV